jgi:predicted metal-dependent enzyme (double-stranded beta helix superfamily)
MRRSGRGNGQSADDKVLEWQGSDQAKAEAIQARGIVFTPEELAGTTREHHLGSETEPELFEVKFGPNTVVQPHAHLCDEIIYVIAGQLILGSRVLEPGSSVLIAGQTLYSFRTGPEACTSSTSVLAAVPATSRKTNSWRSEDPTWPLGDRSRRH